MVDEFSELLKELGAKSVTQSNYAIMLVLLDRFA